MMNTFYIRTRRIVSRLELLFSLLFLTVGFLQASSLTFGKPIISFVQWPTIALGGLLLLYRLLFFRKFLHSRGILLLVLFAASSFLSMILMRGYGLHENVRYTVFLVFQFGLLYAYDRDRAPEENRKHLILCMKYYLILTGLLSILSFVFMAMGFRRTYIPAKGEEGPAYYIGFAVGRLFGAYWDPNIAAMLAVGAVLISVYLLMRKKGPGRILYGLNILLQVFYITFSDSRTGRLSLIVGAVVLSALCGAKFLPGHKKALRIVSLLLIVCVTAGIALALPVGIKDGYNSVTRWLSEKTSSSDPDDSVPFSAIDRAHDYKGDVSNRRFDIWKAAVEVFESSPVYGVSRGNILRYVDDRLPQSYLVGNDHMRFESMHNMFLEILVSQGLLGIVPFVLFAAWAVWGILRRWKTLWNSPNFLLYVLLLSFFAAVCCCTLVMAEIVYVISPLSTLFWLSLGHMDQSLSWERASTAEK